MTKTRWSWARYLACSLACALLLLGCSKDAPNKSGSEKPAAEKPPAEKPTAEKPTAEKPTAEKPAAEKPALVTVTAEGVKLDPPVEKAAIPPGSWICDMGTVHYARSEKGDGECPICMMKLVQHEPPAEK